MPVLPDGVPRVVVRLRRRFPLILNRIGAGKTLKGEPPCNEAITRSRSRGRRGNAGCGVLVRNEQGLLPMLELIEQSRMATDELMRASIVAVLELSARQSPTSSSRAKRARDWSAGTASRRAVFG